MTTRIDTKVYNQIKNHLEESYPHEACGFLFGIENQSAREITSAILAENISDENRKRRFVIKPLDYLKAEKYATANDLTLLGIYHSHPDQPTIPSKHDLEFALPYFSYVIASIYDSALTELKSYKLINNEFVSEPISLYISANTSLV